MTTTTLTPAIGRDALDYRDARHPDRPLEINIYRPARAPARRSRRARPARHQAQRRRVPRLLDRGGREAPPAHRRDDIQDEPFPKPENYNNGHGRRGRRGHSPREDWLYAILPRVVEALRAGGVTRRAAGTPLRPFRRRAVRAPPDGHAGPCALRGRRAGNPGWYTLPTLDRPFPEGLGGLGLGPADLARWLAYPMTILAGDRDIDTGDENLPKTRRRWPRGRRASPGRTSSSTWAAGKPRGSGSTAAGHWSRFPAWDMTAAPWARRRPLVRGAHPRFRGIRRRDCAGRLTGRGLAAAKGLTGINPCTRVRRN